MWYVMRIILSSKFAIKADQHSYQILRINKRKRNGRQVDEWRTVGWYMNVESLIAGFAEYQIRMSNVETLTELLKFKHDLVAELRERLPTNFRNAA